MTARRLLAVLVAVVLIGVALLIRDAIDNGDENGSSGGGGGTPRLVCTPELERVCSALGPDVDLTIEEAGVTAAKLEGASTKLAIDGWLAPGRWGEMVVQARKGSGKDPLLT